MSTRAGGMLSGAAPGQRWVLRTRLPDGSATDLIGWLERVDSSAVILSDAGGRRHRVDRTDLVAARRAPAAAGGPPPERTSAAELERLAATGWIAGREPLGEWLLRAAGGFTGRANSCLAVGDPGMPVAAAAEKVVAFATRHGITPMAQVVAGSPEEAALRGVGWADCYVPTAVLVTRLAPLLGADPVPPGVEVSEELSDPWWRAYLLSRPNDADPGTVRMILESGSPRAFAAAHPDGAGAAAIARGHLADHWLGLTSVWTAPDRRRRGLATSLIRALGHWAARRGGRYCYLQVAAANTDAVAAYGRLGFVAHHRYGYLAPPRA